jgi:hypothetical protein
LVPGAPGRKGSLFLPFAGQLFVSLTACASSVVDFAYIGIHMMQPYTAYTMLKPLTASEHIIEEGDR